MSELQTAVDNLEICRLCLNLTVVKINLFTDDFAKMVEILTSLKIKPNDSLPQVSCLKCARDVKTAFLVRRRIIQSHRAMTIKINRMPSHISRINAETNNEASTSTALSSSQLVTNTETPIQQLRGIIDDSLTNYEASTSTVLSSSQLVTNTETPIQQLSGIIDDSLPDIEENNESPQTDIASIHEDESDETYSEPVQNESTPLDQEPADLEVNMDNLASEKPNISNCMKLQANSSRRSENIQNVKLAINTKYSDMLNSCKQKLYAWKLMNKKDQLNIIKWMEKKSIVTKNKPKLASPIQHKKREPIKMYCNICQIKFTNKIKYKNHMSRHRHKVCPICDKQIRSAYLKKHMTLHEDSPAMCEVCGITCKNPVSLKMHFFYYHKSNLSVCEDCGRSFKTKTKLLYHQRKDHTKERNFKCETCGKCFFSKMYLTKHIDMKHMKMRPHICEYCGKGFSGKHALRTHIRQHTNEAPFQCNFCCERFRQRVSLRGHLKSRHKIEEENKVFCDTCGKGFATTVALDVHFRLHTEIKCPCCSDTFAEKTYLDQHMSMAHPNLQYQDDNVEVGWM